MRGFFFFLLQNEKCYGTELARIFDTSLSPIQNALDRLEAAGVIVSFLIGRTRVYTFNPRYPFLAEILALLKKAYEFMPSELKESYYERTERRRPRRKGKAL